MDLLIELSMTFALLSIMKKIVVVFAGVAVIIFVGILNYSGNAGNPMNPNHKLDNKVNCLPKDLQPIAEQFLKTNREIRNKTIVYNDLKK